ncbi:MAG: hypothetical protein ACLR78_00210 [Roseburia sp.]
MSRTPGKYSAIYREAVEKAGYHVGDDVVFAMDAAASELYDEETGVIHFPGRIQSGRKRAGRGSRRRLCKGLL